MSYKILINLIYHISQFAKKKKEKKRKDKHKYLMRKLGPITSKDIISASCFSATEAFSHWTGAVASDNISSGILAKQDWLLVWWVSACTSNAGNTGPSDDLDFVSSIQDEVSSEAAGPPLVLFSRLSNKRQRTKAFCIMLSTQVNWADITSLPNIYYKLNYHKKMQITVCKYVS